MKTPDWSRGLFAPSFLILPKIVKERYPVKFTYERQT